MQHRRGNPIFGLKVATKPAGTRCYVPGFLSDADQFQVDQSQLGVPPVAVYGVGKALGVKIKLKKKRGPSFESQVVGIPTDVLERAVATGTNPFNPSKKIAPSGVTIMRQELARRQVVPALAPSAVAPSGGITLPVPAPAPAPWYATPFLPAPAPAPAPGYAPTPVTQLPGGEGPVPEEVAKPTGPALATAFGGDMGKLLVPALILLGVTMLGGKKRR